MGSYCLQLIRSTQGEVKLKKSAKKAKPKEAPTKAEKGKPKELEFPVNGFINKYHFMRVSGAILEKLGWPIDKQVNVTLDVQDGALLVRKRQVPSLFFA